MSSFLGAGKNIFGAKMVQHPHRKIGLYAYVSCHICSACTELHHI